MLAQAYWNMRQSVEKVYDKMLLALALTISENVVASQGDLVPESILAMLENISSDEIFYKVSGPDRAYLTGYENLPAAPDNASIASGIPYYFDTHYENRPVRTIILEELYDERELSGWVRVQVAMTRNDREALIRELMGNAASRLLLLVIVAALVVWFAIKKGLKPLDAVRREVANRSAEDLHPIATQAPREIAPLVNAINQLMTRLERNLGAMQRFIADAAHQLRTPLAVIQTEAELALRDAQTSTSKPDLSQLLDATRRTTRLANQLLDHARASSDLGTQKQLQFDLTELAAETTRELVPLALQRNMDLGFESEQIILIKGDSLLLKELLKNVIDNAIRYCPVGARITVRTHIDQTDTTAQLEIEDDGPGIAAAERERVFDRFYRSEANDSWTEGSGLGLAIVKEVAHAHGGYVHLDEGNTGHGLKVLVMLPCAHN